MMQAEEELRRALRRVDPPAGFADRVMAAAASGRSARRARPGGWAGARLAAAAIIALAVAGGIWYRGEQRRQAGEEAKRQVLLSLRIASEKLQLVRALVNAEPN